MNVKLDGLLAATLDLPVYGIRSKYFQVSLSFFKAKVWTWTVVEVTVYQGNVFQHRIDLHFQVVQHFVFTYKLSYGSERTCFQSIWCHRKMLVCKGLRAKMQPCQEKNVVKPCFSISFFKKNQYNWKKGYIERLLRLYLNKRILNL